MRRHTASLAPARSTRLPLFSALLCALLGCGGPSSTGPVTTPTPTPDPVAQTDPPPASGERSPWDGLGARELSAFVTERAIARLREVQPDLDPARLDAYRADPTTAPALSGRAVERLLDLAVAATVSGRLDEAKQTIRLVRARAKNRNSAFAATTLLSEIERRQAGEDAIAQERAIGAVLRELPRPRFGAATVVFQLFQTDAQVDANVAQVRSQMVALETASSVLYFEAILRNVVQNRDRFLRAIATVRAENEARPADAPFAFSTVDLTRVRDAQPVVVGVWDTGTQPSLFESQLFSDAAGAHGVISDPVPTQTAYTYQPEAAVLERYTPFLRGIMDLRAGMASSPDAQRVLELERGITDVDELRRVERALDEVGEWAHGTHVAGILLAGNPKAKVAIFRSAWAGENRTYYERGPTDAELDAERANVEIIAAFIRANRVRVVNASLGFSLDYIEDALRHQPELYATDEAVRARAAVVQGRRKEAWAWIFAQCPETLFVVAAGNSNRDIVEYDDVPAAIDAPNVIVVGAVDKWGNWSTFTNSNPERVRLFDLGVEVDSVIPSGAHVPLSGTSMASPNVANLAAKMIAVDPALTPARVRTVLEETGDAIAAPFSGRIVHEQRAIDRVRRERGRGARAR